MSLLALSFTNFLFIVWVLLICVRHNLVPNFDANFLNRNYVALKAFFISLQFSSSFYQNLDQRLGARKQFQGRKGSVDGCCVAECAVCLCEINETDEIRELQCQHYFHGDCLDKWIAYRHSTCPVCRSFLAAPCNELVFIFKFSSFRISERFPWGLP
ncbi:E3 ubiquitin-protein ligase RHA2B [Heracleum sosnowskyi]|uniref:E3 ubiquitin-protein ligase RHA2B n=1 Tax=Heracleum sosnowskyi TaxID=360622 RepID=A0AAD8MJM6_9APIA|nr:E3 ubiquitin-protein ligase RHA2B [Heracleum sosnowskyi]